MKTVSKVGDRPDRKPRRAPRKILPSGDCIAPPARLSSPPRMPAPSSTSPRQSAPAPAAPVAAGSVARADAALAEDHRLLAQWHEELAARREERIKLQARHRDRLEDALDHLASLRQNARDRQADIAAIGRPSDADTPDAALPAPGSPLPAASAPTAAPEPFAPEDLAAYRFPSLDLLRPASSAEQ